MCERLSLQFSMLLGEGRAVRRSLLDEGSWVTGGMQEAFLLPTCHEMGSFDPLRIPTVVCCHATGPRVAEPSNHGLRSLKP